jgi:indole-3-glycerol phosphate synthase/phosphoribosylanthranilate isomerase
MNVLEKIVLDKRQEVAQRKLEFPLKQFESELTHSDRDFKQALIDDHQQRGAAFILECKKASPSKGLIREVFDLDEICDAYSEYASCVSVLTDEKYFQGEFERLPEVRNRLSQPVLCKDFFVDEYQVYLARFYGANAILLMLSVLTDDEYNALQKIAVKLGMAILTEVSNAEEMDRAIALQADILGINNRNLRDLSTDLNQTPLLVNQFNKKASTEQQANTVLISESGIYQHDQVKKLAPYVRGYLVGSSLMAQEDLKAACRDLTRGEHKVCGMTRLQDIETAAHAGAKYVGFIMVESSPRYIAIDVANALIEHAKQSFNLIPVLVVKDLPLDEVVSMINALKVDVVQLHGNEDASFIESLRQQLKQRDSKVQIWKAIAVSDALPELFPKVDKVLLDTKSADGGSGGTGLVFDWRILDSLSFEHPPIMLAGGLNPDNISLAKSLPVVGFDLNSGVEVEPGIKSAEKINQTFEQILG